MERILIVDDEKNIRESLAMILEDAGYGIQRAKDGNEALQLLNEAVISLVLLDIRLPGKSGLEVLPEIISTKRDIPVIMISGQGTLQLIDQAIKIGAADFIEKPLIKSRILTSIKNILELKSLQKENKKLQEENKNLWAMVEKKYEMKGQSASMESMSRKIFRGAPTDLCILIEGKKGTGKELAARVIHQNSLRKGGPFVIVNCADISNDLIEKELFGYEDHPGRLELANGGTLLLNEIDQFPLNIQVKLAKVLQEDKLRRIDGQEDITVDVRVIGTTTKNPAEEIEKKKLDQGLYYRLKEISLRLSPLRERKEDIPALVEHFLREFCEEEGISKKTLSQEALQLLMEYDYPDNVGELKKIVKSLAERTRGEKIMAAEVPGLL